MSEQLITLATYQYSIDAELDRSRLEAEGIEAVVLDDGMANINWIYSLAAGGVRLQVRETEAELASEVLGLKIRPLDERLPGRAVTEPPAAEPRHCPDCDSTHVRMRGWRTPFVVLYAVILSLIAAPFFFLFSKHWDCQDCGAHWKSR